MGKIMNLWYSQAMKIIAYVVAGFMAASGGVVPAILLTAAVILFAGSRGIPAES